MCVWCAETKTERDAAVDCIVLSIREIGPSTRRFHDDASKIPCFDTLTVEIGMCLARGDPIRAGYGGRLSRIAYLRNWALDSAISRRHTEDSSFDTLALEFDVCLVRGDQS